MIATATTANGIALTASKDLGKNATHVVIAHTQTFADLVAERDPKAAAKLRRDTANRFGAPVGDTHIASRHSSEKAAKAAARKLAAKGNDVEVAALAY